VPDAYNPPSFQEIVTSITKSGLLLSERTIRRYHAAVQARGFVILAGVSGTGKTWLAEAYADAIGARFLSVRVAPNWHSNEDLLGYLSPLTGVYQHTGFSRFLIEADGSFRQAPSTEAARPFHVLLDEMNLARVEHYFADFLSALEQRQRRGEVTLTLGSQEVTVHRNLVFVGTVNMDETTHGFAPKVFDRAQLIEVELDPALFASHVATRGYARGYAGDLARIRAAVAEAAPIAFRTADDFADYIEKAVAIGADWEEAFDEAVLQKVLPRIRGMDPVVGEALGRLVEITEGRYPLSHARAMRMLEDFRRGVASFF
jgi:MoxR-like ATPase